MTFAERMTFDLLVGLVSAIISGHALFALCSSRSQWETRHHWACFRLIIFVTLSLFALVNAGFLLIEQLCPEQIDPTPLTLLSFVIGYLPAHSGLWLTYRFLERHNKIKNK